MSADQGQPGAMQPGGYPQPGAPQPGGYPDPPAGRGFTTGDYGYGSNVPASEQFRQQYGLSPDWPGTVAPRGTNSLAIAALCCSIAQLVAGPVSGIPAIVLGAMSLRQIRETGEDGRGMAVAGLALGIAGVAIFVIAVIAIVALVGSILHSPP